MAAQPLLGCGNDRPDDSDEHPAVFYIESTSQDHQKAPGRDTGTSTTAKSSITQNDFSAHDPDTYDTCPLSATCRSSPNTLGLPIMTS